MGLGQFSNELCQIGLNYGVPKIVTIILIILVVVIFILFIRALLVSVWYFISDYDRSTDEKIIRWNKSAKNLVICAVVIVIFVAFCFAYTDDSSGGQNPNPNPNPNPKPTYTPKQTSIYQDRATAISNAMDYRSAAVRNAAVSMISSRYGGSYNVGQICDIFDYSLSNWVYVNDPAGRDYYAPASTSVNLMRGDCDDFAIMMVSLIDAIGGSAHYVSAKNANGEGHAYAEVLLGTDYNTVSELIDSISRHYGGVSVSYTIDTNSYGTDVYWLNLDWQENHAGSKFFKSVGDAFIVDSSGNYKISTRNY